MAVRVSAFVDGFNLYHALSALKADHLKWLDLNSLCKEFAPSPQYQISDIYYFTAFATWRPDPFRRHRQYVKAMQARGVTVVLGRFKEKDSGCLQCGSTWTRHEEKETDVNLAIYLLDKAYTNTFDRALVVSADSDLAPAIKMVKSRFPQKQIRVLTPVGRRHSWDLVNAAGGKSVVTSIKRIHIERSLLPKEIFDANGQIVVNRPKEYEPPS